MYITKENHSGYSCSKCHTHLAADMKVIGCPGYHCTKCRDITTTLTPINIDKAYKHRQKDYGIYVPNEVPFMTLKDIKFPHKLIKDLLETVEATHETNNDPRLALEILLAFYKRYSTELYNLAEMLERSEELPEGDETMIRLFYGCKDNYYNFKD